MKIILENRYIKSYKFNNKVEHDIFLANQIISKKLILAEQGERYSYCYVGYNSLNSDKLFLISFDSYNSEGELNFLFWSKNNLMVIDNGSEIFFINENLEVISSYSIITPLIGFYITESNALLVLEEATMKLISSSGEILRSEQFDLLDDYYVTDDVLHIRMGEINRTIDLCPARA